MAPTNRPEETTQDAQTTQIVQNTIEKPKKSLNARRKASFSKYIRKMVKKEHKGFSLSPEAVPIINAVVNDIFERVAAEASRLCLFHRKPEITVTEIRAAIKVLLPNDITKHMNLGESAESADSGESGESDAVTEEEDDDGVSE